MIKFAVAIDGLKYSDSAVQYAAFLSKEAQAHLVGIFLDDFSYHTYRISDLVRDKGTVEKKIVVYENKDKAIREQAVHNFEEVCRKFHLNFSVHHDRNIAITELLHESIYSDLLIIDSKETLTNYAENIPTRFIRDLLSEVQCPLVIVPQVYEPVKKIFLLYDGGPSSVYAIKMFSYLFPSFKNVVAEVISVNAPEQSLHLPDIRLMKEFMKRHFPDADYKVMQGNPEKEILHYLKDQKQNGIVVLGAYDRGMVSRWFKHSMADILMKELKIPLFIAHNK
jgi:hypothetical protein